MDYTDFRTAAAEMIADFGNGQQVVFHRKAVTNYDAVADVETVGAEITASVVAVILPRADNDRSTPYDDLTRNNFVKIIVPANGLGVFVPAPGDQIEVPGEASRFTVTAVKTARPDGAPIIYTLQAEKGAST